MCCGGGGGSTLFSESSMCPYRNLLGRYYHGHEHGTATTCTATLIHELITDPVPVPVDLGANPSSSTYRYGAIWLVWAPCRSH